MKENKYDDDRFFSQYAQMSRSVEGLKGAGEWHILQKMLPDFTGKRILDLGCGFGWHCIYAIEHGAKKRDRNRYFRKNVGRSAEKKFFLIH